MENVSCSSHGCAMCDVQTRWIQGVFAVVGARQACSNWGKCTTAHPMQRKKNKKKKTKNRTMLTSTLPMTICRTSSFIPSFCLDGSVLGTTARAACESTSTCTSLQIDTRQYENLEAQTHQHAATSDPQTQKSVNQRTPWRLVPPGHVRKGVVAWKGMGKTCLIHHSSELI